MEALEAIRKRRSVRKFSGAPIPRADLEAILDAARLAATGYNAQPWTFVVVTEPEGRAALSLGKPWLLDAAALVAVVLDPSTRFWREDGCSAIANMLIAATALGYGSCWLQGDTMPREEPLKQALGVPPDLRLLSLVALGVPAEWPTRPKKALAEVVRWEQYGAPAEPGSGSAARVGGLRADLL